MKWRDVLADWGINKLQLKLGFLDMEFGPQDADRNAAWELYVELATRISTQPLPAGLGGDSKALASHFSLFLSTRTPQVESGATLQVQAAGYAPWSGAVVADGGEISVVLRR